MAETTTTPDTTVSVDELVRQALAGEDASVNLNVTQNSGEVLKTKAGSGNCGEKLSIEF